MTSSSKSGSNKSSRAWYLLSAASLANLFQGQTARQSSQPYMRFPIFGLKCSGTGLLLSIVRYEIQRRASNLNGCGNAAWPRGSRQYGACSNAHGWIPRSLRPSRINRFWDQSQRAGTAGNRAGHPAPQTSGVGRMGWMRASREAGTKSA